ncbi:hypothetical protein A3C96_03005 [Candidatus Uhrbacteria bacterium RIFCSPHIGHO2_02_FULL_60_10]|uniref:SHS2 domain-containing protein n=1 Tax=Candidatus Uhrbacteria bacterium RIFCSPHIGHO2_02_FULL_60_10 TaxID=1802392 RepID=A0A1F7U8K9_9BACT|nr:MAG: hypothetical protein A3C96_03005 [Candidatus Uhrbacteria bacterium RIFCSPHIGHO2_02_FULL_60_10]
MGLFGPKKESFLGVDLGAGGIKLVELQNEKGRARLVTYGFTERLPDAQPANLADAPEQTAALLKKICLKARTSTRRVIAGLPIASVFSAVITIPKDTDEKMKESIQYQARKLIPVPLEEMVMDYKLITPPVEKTAEVKATKPKGEEAAKAEPPKSVQVLITGGANAMVKKYVNVFKLAGLELVSLETEAMGLIRSLVGKDRSIVMIVDIGALRTNIIIVENGIPYVTRSLDMGGATLTKALSKSLNMDLKAAEEMKCDIKGVSAISPGEGLPKIYEQTMVPMVTELQYSMDLYVGQGDDRVGKTVEKIVLTGGSALLPSLAGYFAKQLNIRTYVGDPWARVVYPDELRPVLDEIGPRFAVAVGLSMRDIE